MNGLLIVDKPKDWTSHDVVAKIRNTLKVKKVGHGGTLDPTATGLLIVLIGEYTKHAESYLGLDKSYMIDMEFGSTTTTGDETGETIVELPTSNEQLVSLVKQDVDEVLEKYTGTVSQKVPWYSAIKVNGKKLYEYARGKSPNELKELDGNIERPVRHIEIYSAGLVSFDSGTLASYPNAVVEITCSSGTYTRVFVEDVGKVLGLPAHQIALRRTRIGKFTLENAVLEKEFGDKETLSMKLRN